MDEDLVRRQFPQFRENTSDLLARIFIVCLMRTGELATRRHDFRDRRPARRWGYFGSRLSVILLVGFLATACGIVPGPEPPGYDIATTEEVVQPPASTSCAASAGAAPKAFGPGFLDVHNGEQIKNRILTDMAWLACDPHVQVRCRFNECSTYHHTYHHGRKIGSHKFEIDFCEHWCDAHSLRPTTVFLTKKRLHEEFWLYSHQSSDIGPSAFLRCDILPADGEIIPTENTLVPSVTPKYRCYAQELFSGAHKKYKVRIDHSYSGSQFRFQEER